MGYYPVALIPGQFVDYYKPFTPEQMRFLPLNSATAGPPVAGIRLQDIRAPEPPVKEAAAAEEEAEAEEEEEEVEKSKEESEVDSDSSSEDDSSSDSSSGSSSAEESESSSSESEKEVEEKKEENDQTKVFVRELRKPIGERNMVSTYGYNPLNVTSSPFFFIRCGDSWS